MSRAISPLFHDAFNSVQLAVWNKGDDDNNDNEQQIDSVFRIMTKYCDGQMIKDSSHMTLTYDANVGDSPCHMRIIDTTKCQEIMDKMDAVIILFDLSKDLVSADDINAIRLNIGSRRFLLSFNQHISPVDLWMANRAASQLSNDVGLECKVISNASELVEYMLTIAKIVLGGDQSSNTAKSDPTDTFEDAPDYFLDTVSTLDRPTALPQQQQQQHQILNVNLKSLYSLAPLEFSQIVSLSLAAYCQNKSSVPNLDSNTCIQYSQELAEILFLLYRLVASPHQLLSEIDDQLNCLYNQNNNNKTGSIISKTCYLNLLVSWYQTYGQDFRSESMLRQLAHVIQRHAIPDIMSHAYVEPLCTLPYQESDIDAWWGYDESKGNTNILMQAAKDSLPPRGWVLATNICKKNSQESSRLIYATFDNKEEYYAQFLSSPTEILAIEISRISWFLFEFVKARESVRYIYHLIEQNKRGKNDINEFDDMLHFCEFMEFLDYLVIWSFNLIIDRPTDKDRGLMIGKLIGLARQLMHNNDHASCASIIEGIRACNEKCWKHVGNKQMESLQQLEGALEKVNAYNVMEEEYMGPPMNPTIPFIQNWIEYCYSKMSDIYFDDGKIKWGQVIKIGFSLIYLAQCQENPPDIEPPRLGLSETSHLSRYGKKLEAKLAAENNNKNKNNEEQEMMKKINATKNIYSSMVTYWSEESAQAQFRRYVALQPIDEDDVHKPKSVHNDDDYYYYYYHPSFLQRNRNKHLFSDAMFLKIPLVRIDGLKMHEQQQQHEHEHDGGGGGSNYHYNHKASSSSSTAALINKQYQDINSNSKSSSSSSGKKKSWKWIKSNSSKLFQPK